MLGSVHRTVDDPRGVAAKGGTVHAAAPATRALSIGMLGGDETVGKPWEGMDRGETTAYYCTPLHLVSTDPIDRPRDSFSADTVTQTCGFIGPCTISRELIASRHIYGIYIHVKFYPYNVEFYTFHTAQKNDAPHEQDPEHEQSCRSSPAHQPIVRTLQPQKDARNSARRAYLRPRARGSSMRPFGGGSARSVRRTRFPSVAARFIQS